MTNSSKVHFLLCTTILNLPWPWP